MRTVVLLALLVAACGTEDDPEPECYVWTPTLECLPCVGVLMPDQDDRGRDIYWCVTDDDPPKARCTLTCEEGPPDE